MDAERVRRFLVAPDSFKGTFSAAEVAEAIAAGVGATGAEADVCPVADGGEGTLEALLDACGGTVVEAEAHDPLRRPIRAGFGLLADGMTAVVEVASASGLPLLAADELDPEGADSFGTGELIAAAIAAGAKIVVVAAGGSATTDGGRGAIEAVRAAGGAEGVALEVLCDVDVPYEQAAPVFAPQKGADPAAVARLSARLDEFAATLSRDPRGMPMGGCAGGLSGGLMGAFDARLRPGANYVLDRLGFEERLERADAVISGEGRIDAQSLRGKLVGTIADLCLGAGRRLDVVAGQDGLDGDEAARAGIAAIHAAPTLKAIAEAGRRIAAAGSAPSQEIWP
jgi:glycerate kinase